MVYPFCPKYITVVVEIFLYVFCIMRLPVVLLAVLLCLVVLVDVRLPPAVSNLIGSTPGLLVALIAVFYLYTTSPLLGLIGIVAAYSLVQKTGYFNTDTTRIPTLIELQSGLPNMTINGATYTPTHQFPVTLEETVVNNLVPMAQSNLPKPSQ